MFLDAGCLQLPLLGEDNETGEKKPALGSHRIYGQEAVDFVWFLPSTQKVVCEDAPNGNHTLRE